MSACEFSRERPEDLREGFGLTDGCQFAELYSGDFVEHEGRKYCPFHAPEGLGEAFGGGAFQRVFTLDEYESQRLAQSSTAPPSELCARSLPTEELEQWKYLTQVVKAPIDWKRTSSPSVFELAFAIQINTDDDIHRALHAFVGLAELEANTAKNLAIDLSGVRFPKPFVAYQTLSDVTHGPKKDMPPIILDGAVFEEDAVFNLLRIDGPLSAKDAQFRKDAHFSETAVLGLVDFSYAEFGTTDAPGFADFNAFEAKQIATFGSAQFYGEAQFDKARLEVTAEFDGATFHQLASFDNALFGAILNFDEVKAKGDVDLSASIVDEARQPIEGDDDHNTPSTVPESTFIGATFEGVVDFSNRTFNDAADFTGVIFGKAPEFHNATLHQNTDFSGARFLDASSEGAARAYRTLKLAMETVRASTEEANFFALEQRALRRRSDTPFSVKLASWAYEFLADYGRSFMRPLFWLFIFVGAFALIFTALFSALAPEAAAQTGEIEGRVALLADMVRFAIEQAVRPFVIWSPRYVEGRGGIVAEAFAQAPLLVGLVSTGLSIAALALAALCILALRRRFQMKG